MRTRRTAGLSVTRRKPTSRGQWRNGRRTAAAPCSSWATCSTAKRRQRIGTAISTLPIPAERKRRRNPHRRPSSPRQPPTATSMPRLATSTSSRKTTMRRWTNCWNASPRSNPNWKAEKREAPRWTSRWHSWKNPTSWRRSTWEIRTARGRQRDRPQSRPPCRKPERTRQNP